MVQICPGTFQNYSRGESKHIPFSGDWAKLPRMWKEEENTGEGLSFSKRLILI
ncbi:MULTISPECIES: hypothetical protein [Clostridia]|uniref:hypothetical protein n=1 Tax=Clostridia TaxID=186801 RepID=UPI00131448EF|nr:MULTISPECIES: hypothetical protein [Clostridia]